jgi:hypothetical protein
MISSVTGEIPLPPFENAPLYSGITLSCQFALEFCKHFLLFDEANPFPRQACFVAAYSGTPPSLKDHDGPALPVSHLNRSGPSFLQFTLSLPPEAFPTSIQEGEGRTGVTTLGHFG